MNKPKLERTILCDNTLFRTDDIVVVNTVGSYGSEYKGRISDIDESVFYLDMSEKYCRVERRFEYKNVESIRYLHTEGESE